MDLVVVRRARDARFAVCRDCGLLPPNPYWGAAKQRGLHESGTGHRVDLAAPAPAGGLVARLLRATIDERGAVRPGMEAESQRLNQLLEQARGGW